MIDWVLNHEDYSVTKFEKSPSHKRIFEIGWEHDSITQAMEYCKHKDVCLDIGSSYGFTAYEFSKYFNTVHCFEVDKNIHYYLKKNVNQFENKNVFVHEFGLGDSETEVGLTLRKIRNKVATFSNKVNLKGKGCKIKKLDSLDLPKVDFIKIDVEGFEEDVIKGAINLIKKDKPTIMIECLDNLNTLNFLETLDYVIVKKLDEHNYLLNTKEKL